MKRKIAQIPYTTVEAGLREAEMNANRSATELATKENHHRRQGLARFAHELDDSITELEASAAAKIAEARALKPKARSAHTATAAEDMAHSKYMGRFNSKPRTSNSNRMDPPPAKGQWSPLHSLRNHLPPTLGPR